MAGWSMPGGDADGRGNCFAQFAAETAPGRGT